MKKYRFFILPSLVFVVCLIALAAGFDFGFCASCPAECLTDPLTTLAVGPAFAPLLWKRGKNNMGGYKQYLAFIPFDSVTETPKLPAEESAESNKAYVTATGSFAFKADGGITAPVVIYSTDGEVGFTAAPQGEKDGISYLQTLTYFHPGNSEEMHAFNALVKNTPGFFLFEDSDGKQQIIGLEGLPASVSPNFNGGQKRADRRGTTYTVTADSNYSAVFMGTPVDINALINPGEE